MSSCDSSFSLQLVGGKDYKALKVNCSHKSSKKGIRIMGKRWTAEQVSETTEYIKHLQLRVKELTRKREQIRKEKLSASAAEAFPTVKINRVGSDVFVSIDALKCNVVLSELLFTLQNNGVDIVSAASSVFKDKVFYTVNAK
ncbi:hypothetical protein KI387_010763, partial [Taxus chinensis]